MTMTPAAIEQQLDLLRDELIEDILMRSDKDPVRIHAEDMFIKVTNLLVRVSML